ncbi:MAG: hypothetical protein P9L88_05295, partial [Candidatus Tantalella remota]|nr:hypothetical protein [Candidatus Tantalella remota]
MKKTKYSIVRIFLVILCLVFSAFLFMPADISKADYLFEIEDEDEILLRMLMGKMSEKSLGKITFGSRRDITTYTLAAPVVPLRGAYVITNEDLRNMAIGEPVIQIPAIPDPVPDVVLEGEKVLSIEVRSMVFPGKCVHYGLESETQYSRIRTVFYDAEEKIESVDVHDPSRQDESPVRVDVYTLPGNELLSRNYYEIVEGEAFLKSFILYTTVEDNYGNSGIGKQWFTAGDPDILTKESIVFKKKLENGEERIIYSEVTDHLTGQKSITLYTEGIRSDRYGYNSGGVLIDQRAYGLDGVTIESRTRWIWNDEQVTVIFYTNGIVQEKLVYDHNGETSDLNTNTNSWVLRAKTVYADGIRVEVETYVYTENGRQSGHIVSEYENGHFSSRVTYVDSVNDNGDITSSIIK